MRQYPHLYIDGQWTEPIEPREVELIDPTREEAFARVALGSAADAERAVAAARRAFDSFSATSVDERIALIDRVVDAYESRIDEFSELIAREVGIPVANRAQVTGPAQHMRVARDLLREYPFESRIGGAVVRREPIGVCALISPWNWPVQTGVIKLIYALAAGCTVVAKPSINSAASGALWPRSCTRRAYPRASSTWSTAGAATWATPSPVTRTSTWSPSPDPPGPADRSGPPPRTR